MPLDGWSDLEHRVLVLAPTGRDAVNSVEVLTRAGLTGVVCRDVEEIRGAAAAGVGVVLLTEEGLARDAIGVLSAFLAEQPSWSDLPIILLTRGGPESAAAVRAMDALGNVILLERPVRVRTLVTAATTALRGRDKQYQVRAQLAELRGADERKDEFLATLAHELRNPLAPIRTGLQILRGEGGLSAVGARTREMMERQIAQMVRLIDDLMDVSRITRGKTELRRERLDLRRVVDAAVESSRPWLDQAGLTFTVSLPPHPMPVDGDAMRLAQVLSNLLNNAAKYTPRGGNVHLAAEVGADDVTVRVRDDGVGIPVEMLPFVFDIFTQVGRSIDRAQGGLGIGLTLVRSLVEMHGGKVSVESGGAGRGSTFTVRLPLADVAPARAPVDVPVAAGAPPLRVLVVDDNRDAAESVALYLESVGHHARTADSAAAALEVARAFRPELVLLDLGLPDMNGYEVARRMRLEGSRAVLVALTGWGSAGDKVRSTDAGFDFHLTKPADAADLQRALAHVADSRQA